ncbi:hypothetical protein METBIDRAFT_190442 [Metschnikowia bicuspidata var. bicuspidata NRRL YB-4993]|uniref:Uncharacterized protein n=1 Tax=Metschnikowia bicuspidata var. bicuspidata NRRL YB-4993 TaxID=869754 RepID=A0A1A0HCL8_9ASCO|nr:hypothetical protein METBIDRAFT_190442 [Metschnikowia bicuspidata var. bicuspidata NRRL YB-4993]OBA21668.1 hypothetical protein METBIDRAFT_190442 [Metschnikowia bicuspidata var. bicuspidata NRRL YB-4993]
MSSPHPCNRIPFHVVIPAALLMCLSRLTFGLKFCLQYSGRPTATRDQSGLNEGRTGSHGRKRGMWKRFSCSSFPYRCSQIRKKPERAAISRHFPVCAGQPRLVIGFVSRNALSKGPVPADGAARAYLVP